MENKLKGAKEIRKEKKKNKYTGWRREPQKEKKRKEQGEKKEKWKWSEEENLEKKTWRYRIRTEGYKAWMEK